MFKFFQKENRINKARPQTNNLLKRGMVFGFVFLLVLTTMFGILPTETHAASVNDDPGAGQRGTPPDTDGSFWGIKEAFASALEGFLAVVAKFFLFISSFLLGAAGLVLNAALELSITDFKTYANSSGVNLAWKTFRDVANMFFIFILLYIAIGTILGLGNINLKKMLARIVIIALLLNFSLFFTKVIIDASNILAVGFYNQIVQVSCGEGTAQGISNAFVCKMGMSNLYSSDTFNIAIAGKDAGQILSYGVLGSVFMIIAAFIFMAAAIMFIARSIIFIFLLVLSPLAFIAMALPNDKYSKEWWDKLFEQCIFAPAFLAFLWVTLQVVGSVSLNANISDIFGVDTGAKVEDSVGKTILNFGIIIGLLIASLVVAKRTGAYGAGGAMKMLNKAGKGVQNKLRAATGAMTLGAVGYAGRRVLGATGRRVADSEKLKEFQSKGGFWRRALAGATRGVAKKAAETSFDARTVVGGLGKAGGKGGFDKFKEERDKAAVKKEQDLKPSKEKIDQAQEKLYRLKETAENGRKKDAEKVNALEAELNSQPEKQKLERLETSQKSDKDWLQKTAGFSETGKVQLEKRIADREREITNTRNALELDPRTGERRTKINKIRDSREKFEKEIQTEINEAQKAVDELKGVDEKEAGKRFDKLEPDEKLENIARAKGATKNLTDEGLKKFIKEELEKTKEYTGEKLDKYIKEERGVYIKLSQKDSQAKIRALDYARKVEKSWIGLIRGTRKSEAAAIRIDITKDKDEKKWDKIFSAIGKGKKEDGRTAEKPKVTGSDNDEQNENP